MATPTKNGTYLVAQLRDELLVAGQHVGTILDETAEGPKTQWRLAVLLDDVEVRVVDTPAHLARLLDHGVHSLREWVVEQWERCLHRIVSFNRV